VKKEDKAHMTYIMEKTLGDLLAFIVLR